MDVEKLMEIGNPTPETHLAVCKRCGEFNGEHQEGCLAVLIAQKGHCTLCGGVSGYHLLTCDDYPYYFIRITGRLK